MHPWKGPKSYFNKLLTGTDRNELALDISFCYRKHSKGFCLRDERYQAELRVFDTQADPARLLGIGDGTLKRSEVLVDLRLEIDNRAALDLFSDLPFEDGG